MKFLMIAFLLISAPLMAQLEKNIEIEIIGRPSWQMLIPLEENGLILLVKSDITKANVFRFDKDLNQLWKKEVFLDAEKPPSAYTLTNDQVSLLFSETSGMYYQVFEFDLPTGEVDQNGFELREYFVDQDYVFLEDRVLLAGANANGAAFFEHNFTSDTGKLIEQDQIAGKVMVNLFEYQPEENQIESLWSVKTTGYSNEKKKKGAFTKDAFIVYAVLDTAGTILEKHEIRQVNAKFPVDARLIKMTNGKKLVIGSYQSNLGDKGIYTYDLTKKGDIKTYSFSSLLKGRTSLAVQDLQAILGSYRFLSNAPLESDFGVIFGGVFLKPQFQTVTEQDPYYSNPYGYGGGYNRYNRFGYQQSRSTSREVFQGYHYPTGFVMELSPEGELLSSNRIDINNMSYQVQQALAYNKKGAVSYCLKGDLAANNFNIGTKPILYKLSDDEGKRTATAKELSYLPSYDEVVFWYDNYFVGLGSKIKVEAISVNDNLSDKPKKKRKGLFGKNKRQSPASFSQIRKTIYLTKVASGAASN